MNEKDEIKMSWDRKVSLKEIAQFYEDKLRELDGKLSKMTEKVEETERISNDLKKELQEALEKNKDEYRRGVEWAKKRMNDELKISTNELIKETGNYMKDARKEFDDYIGSLLKYHEKAILAQTIQITKLYYHIYRYMQRHDNEMLEAIKKAYNELDRSVFVEQVLSSASKVGLKSIKRKEAEHIVDYIISTETGAMDTIKKGPLESTNPFFLKER